MLLGNVGPVYLYRCVVLSGDGEFFEVVGHTTATYLIKPCSETRCTFTENTEEIDKKTSNINEDVSNCCLVVFAKAS